MKKNIFFPLLLAIGIVFTGCFEMTEEYTISGDNSAEFQMNLDMGKMIAMIISMGGEDAVKNDPKLSRLMDTTIRFKNFTDTSTQLTAEQKAWMRNGTMSVKMKPEDELFKMNMRFPFSSIDQLNNFMKPENQEGFGKLMAGVMKDEEKEGEDGEEGEEKNDMGQMNALQNIYKTTFSPNAIHRTFDDAQMEAFSNDESMQQLKQMSAMMGDMKMTTILRLPRPVKKSTGAPVELSADKRTVTIHYDLVKMMEDPKSGTFSLEY